MDTAQGGEGGEAPAVSPPSVGERVATKLEIGEWGPEHMELVNGLEQELSTCLSIGHRHLS